MRNGCSGAGCCKDQFGRRTNADISVTPEKQRELRVWADADASGGAQKDFPARICQCTLCQLRGDAATPPVAWSLSRESNNRTIGRNLWRSQVVEILVIPAERL